ncbi:RICIN domain-containing protein [Streptomyces sp. NPDC006622]|uniref:NHL domain-containing protein n=1 Tax=Streptomyces sp. NPDC006622 TaxID=3155459 RepID=UPI0033AA302E
MSTAQAAVTGRENSAPPISTVAGTGAAGPRGDNEPAVLAQLNRPYGIAVDSVGTLYIVDNNNHRVRKVTTDGRISAFAGTGVPGPVGDGGPAVSAQLRYPREVAVDSEGNVYITDTDNHKIRKVTADGRISTFAGTGSANFSGDGGLATAAQLNLPMGVAVDRVGVVYIADSNNNRIRRVTTDGRISTFAGTGVAGPLGDGGLAVSAQLRCPRGVAVDSEGNVYIADGDNHRVRKVTKADGKISTVAGTGSANFSGDGGLATAAQLNLPMGVAVDSADTLYISDYYNSRVRKVAADGKISTVAGTNTAGSHGDDGPATSAQLRNPCGLAVDCVDALYIADHVNHRVRKIASVRMAGLPESGTVVSWANVRSRLRMAVVRESTEDGAEVHQTLTVPRDHQRWRLVVAGQDDGEVLYRIQNLRSGKVLEVVEARETAGAVVAQRAYEGAHARHQQWRLVPVGSVSDTPRVFEIANGNSGLLLRVDTNARTVIKQHGAEGDHRERQWQLLPV